MYHWIKDVMDTGTLVVDCDETVAEVEEKLAASDTAALPVLNPDHSVFGIVGSADIMRFLRNGGNEHATRAWEICSTRPCLLRLDASIEDAMTIYTEEHCKLLAVIDMHNRFAGVVTPETLLKAYLEPLRLRTDPETGQLPLQRVAEK